MKSLDRVGEKIVSSRLLVLQSKRILLTSAHTHVRVKATDQAELDVQRLESAVRTAHQRYNDAVLQWGSPQSSQYTLVAYTSLIAKAEALRSKLHAASEEVPGRDSNALKIETQALDRIIVGWRAIARRSMAGAVA